MTRSPVAPSHGAFRAWDHAGVPISPVHLEHDIPRGVLGSTWKQIEATDTGTGVSGAQLCRVITLPKHLASGLPATCSPGKPGPLSPPPPPARSHFLLGAATCW